MKLASKGVILLYLFFCSTAVAQEYRYEIGGMAGMSMYMGDANTTSFFQEWNPAAGIIFKSNMNFRWAWEADFSLGRVSGDTKNIKNVFPNQGEASFSRYFYTLGGHVEFNFLPYSDKFSYLNTSKISPYLLLGGGLTLAPGKTETCVTVNVPIGVGVKYKIRNRWNIGLEYSVHKLFSDAFDAPDKNGFHLDNAYGVKNGLFKNKDWYNTLFFSVTWEFGLRDGRCTTD
jgi:opacity protein-like surface antigen